MPQAIPPRHTGDGGPLAGAGDKGSLRTPRSIAAQDRQAFDTTRKRIAAALRHNGALRKLAGRVRFVPTGEGLRIDLVDGVDYSMFASGTTGFVREAGALIATIGDAIRDLPNPVMIRGHTDSLGYGDPRRMNNWILSAGRAETTRRQLAARGVRDARFDRIEGVADHLPLIGGDPADPRNRRVAITLLYRDAIGNR